MMFSKLSSKLTLAMVLISILTIAVAGLLINRELDRQFVSFVEDAQERQNQQVAAAVRRLYGPGGGHGSLEDQLLLLKSAGDVEIVISAGPDHPGGAQGRRTGNRGPLQMGRRTTQPLILPDGSEAALEIIPAANLQKAQREAGFRDAVQRSIFMAALLSISGAVAVSLFFSWGLTKPVKQLTDLLRRVGQGHLKERVSFRGNDELAYLGREFNQLAANLEKQERLRIKLTNDMAHELRTPLANIQAYLEGMNDGVVEVNPENLSQVLGETERLSTLLADLQELAKVERPLVRRRWIDLGELLSTLLGPLAILAEEKGLTLSWNDPGGIRVSGDPEMLKTALRNVVVNAIKYTPAGGAVSVELTGKKGAAMIKISDTGIGIEAQELPFIFERFYRTDDSRSRETGGTGIGLAITAEIIKGHLGSVDVESAPNAGAVFTINLPTNGHLGEGEGP